ncbi:12860_t:CDS:1, partial [Cetraspora pellucida]
MTNANLVMLSVIPDIFFNTTLLHCIWHLEQNLIKNLKEKLDNKFDSFMKAFYQCCNSLSIPIFEHYWAELIQNYFDASDYLIENLNSY